MILSSVGLLLVLALVNTLGLSIKGEEELAVPLDQDEVELELDVSRMVILGFCIFEKVKRMVTWTEYQGIQRVMV